MAEQSYAEWCAAVREHWDDDAMPWPLERLRWFEQMSDMLPDGTWQTVEARVADIRVALIEIQRLGGDLAAVKRRRRNRMPATWTTPDGVVVDLRKPIYDCGGLDWRLAGWAVPCDGGEPVPFVANPGEDLLDAVLITDLDLPTTGPISESPMEDAR